MHRAAGEDRASAPLAPDAAAEVLQLGAVDGPALAAQGRELARAARRAPQVLAHVSARQQCHGAPPLLDPRRRVRRVVEEGQDAGLEREQGREGW